MRLVSLCALLAPCLLVLGCSSETPLEAAPVGSAALPTIATGTPDGERPFYFTLVAMSDEERDAYVEVEYETVRALHTAATGSESWRDADRAVQAVLAEPSPVPAYKLEQNAATYLLPRILEASGPEAAAAAHRYTAMLASNGSPDVLLVEEALDRFGSQWDATSREAIAADIVDSATRYLAKQASCDGCRVSDLIEAVDRSGAARADTRLTEMASALGRLTAES